MVCSFVCFKFMVMSSVYMLLYQEAGAVKVKTKFHLLCTQVFH